MIIYGWKRYAQVLAVLTLVCQQCAMPAEHVLRRLTTKFTLFFIPLFPVSRKHTLTCSACQAENKLSREQAQALAASGGQQVPQQAPQQQYAGPPTPPPQPAYGPPTPAPQPAYGQQRYQQPPMRPPQPMPAQPGPYGNQPPGYQPSLPPMQRPYPGPPQQPVPYPPAGYPQQGGHPYPPGR